MLYVGKARSLQAAACAATSRRAPATRASSSRGCRASWATSRPWSWAREKEAALLENTLIKQHQPRYNVKLRDDKEYLSLRLDPKARLAAARGRAPAQARDGALYFGPYHSATSARQTLRLVNRHFQLRTCTDTTSPVARPPVPAVPDQALPRALRVRGRSRALRRAGAGRGHVPRRSPRRAAPAARGAHARGGRRRSTTSAPPSTAISCARSSACANRTASRWSQNSVDQDVIGLLPAGRPGRGRGAAGARGQADLRAHVRPQGRERARRRAVRAVRGRVLRARQLRAAKRCWLPLEVEAMDGSGRAAGRAARQEREAAGAQEGPARRARADGARQREPRVPREAARERRRAKSRSARPASAAAPAPLPAAHRVHRRLAHGGTDTVASASSRCATRSPTASATAAFTSSACRAATTTAPCTRCCRAAFAAGATSEAGWELPDLLVVDGGRGQLNVAQQALRDLGVDDLPIAALAKEKPNVLGEKLVDRVYLPGQKNPIELRENHAALGILALARDEAHRASNALRLKLGKRTPHQAASSTRCPASAPRRARACSRRSARCAPSKKPTRPRCAQPAPRRPRRSPSCARFTARCCRAKRSAPTSRRIVERAEQVDSDGASLERVEARGPSARERRTKRAIRGTRTRARSKNTPRRPAMRARRWTRSWTRSRPSGPKTTRSHTLWRRVRGQRRLR